MARRGTPLGAAVALLVTLAAGPAPPDFREAALMDGAGPLRVLWSVYLPVSGNIAWAMAIVTFIAARNNFLWPFIITSNDMTTIPLRLTHTCDAFGVRYAQPMPASGLKGSS